MGSTNHGTQQVTHEYFEEATAEEFNKRNLNMRPKGIYKGGYLTKVTDSEISLSTFTAEIGDDNEQISVKTAVDITVNNTTLDSGAINSGTPFIVLRWNFFELQNNYVEIHAIVSVTATLVNDIIVGKCLFSGATLTGFSYEDRTFLNVQDIIFKVEKSTELELYVQLRAGRVHANSGNIIVPEQKVGPFSVPSSPNSRIDLIYIDSVGSIQIQQGTAAVGPVVPDYNNKLVIAEVRLVNGDTHIAANRITDVRAFLVNSATTLGEVYDSGWFAINVNSSYIKNHGLSGIPRIALVYISNTTVDGTGYYVQGVTGHNADAYSFGTYVNSIDGTQIEIKTNQRLTQVSGWAPTSGYAKIIAIL